MFEPEFLTKIEGIRIIDQKVLNRVKAMNQENIRFTDAAAAKVSELIANDDDTSIEKNGVTVLVDAMSIQYLEGAEIDYTDGLSGAQFVIRNPNASTTCGCGSSFSV